MNLESQMKLKSFKSFIKAFALSSTALMIPYICLASVESSLTNLRGQLVGVILPALSVIGMVIAAISFFTGNPQAKQHVVYAILGCIFGFGAQSIVDMISSLVR